MKIFIKIKRINKLFQQYTLNINRVYLSLTSRLVCYTRNASSKYHPCIRNERFIDDLSESYGLLESTTDKRSRRGIYTLGSK